MSSTASTVPRTRVLGIAQDGGHPQAGCTRACCEAAWRDPRRAHRIASLGLLQGEQRWLLDCTPDVVEQLRELGAPPLHGIFLTHAHMGHYTGLVHLGKEAWAAERIPLYVMPGMRAFVLGNQPWRALVDDGHVVLRELEAGVSVPLTPHLRITPWWVPHRGPWTETVAFHVQGTQRSVLFVPDVDRWEDWDRDLVDVLTEVDVAYVDGSFYDHDELPRIARDQIFHPFVTETMDRLRPCATELRQRVRFLHLNHTNPLLDPDSSAWREVHERGFRVAVEGEEVEL